MGSRGRRTHRRRHVPLALALVVFLTALVAVEPSAPLAAADPVSSWGDDWSVAGGPTDTFTVCGTLNNGIVDENGDCEGGTWVGRMWPDDPVVPPNGQFTMTASQLNERGTNGYGAWPLWTSLMGSDVNDTIVPAEDCNHGPNDPPPDDGGYRRDAVRLSCTYQVRNSGRPTLPGTLPTWSIFRRNFAHVYLNVAPTAFPMYFEPSQGNLHGLIRDKDGEVFRAFDIWNVVRRRKAGPITIETGTQGVGSALAQRIIGSQFIWCPDANRLLDLTLPGVFDTTGVCPTGTMPAGSQTVQVPDFEFDSVTSRPSRVADGVQVDEMGGFMAMGLAVGRWQIEFDAYDEAGNRIHVKTPWVDVTNDNVLSFAKENLGELDASFTVDPVPPDPGVYRLTSTSTSDAEPISNTWFVDGVQTSIGDSTIVTFDTPGPHEVRLVSRDASFAEGESTQTIDVPAPTLGLSISFPSGLPHRFPFDTPFDVDVKVSAGADGVGPLSNITFDPGGATYDETSPPVLSWQAAARLDVVSGPTPNPGATSLGPGESQTYRVQLKGMQGGIHTLKSSVRAFDAAAREVERSTSTDVRVEAESVLETKLEIFAPVFPLPEVDITNGSLALLTIDNEVIPATLTVRLTLKNNAPAGTPDADLTGLTLAAPDLDKLWDKTGVPPPVPLPLDQETGPDPSADIGTLEPQASETVEWTMTLKDDGKFKLSTIVLGAEPDGTPIRRVVDAGFEALQDLKLSFELDPNGEPDGTELVQLRSGGSVGLSGELRNHSNTETLVVPLERKIGDDASREVGNARGGYVVADTEEHPECLGPTEFELAPGQRLRVHALIGTMVDGGTRAELTWTIKEPTAVDIVTGEVTPVTDEQIAGKMRELRLSIDDSPVALGPEISTSDLVAWLTAGLGLGVVNFVKGIAEMAKLLVTIATLPLRPSTYITALSVAEWVVTVWLAMTPEERGIWIDNTYNKLATSIDVSLQEFKSSFEAKMTAAAEAWYTNQVTGSLQDVVVKVGAIGGELAVDTVLCPLAVGETLSLAQRAVSRYHDELEESAAAAAAAARAAGNSATQLDDLKYGSPLNPFALRNLYGLSAWNAHYLQQAVDKFGVIIAVKSRNQRTLELFRRYAGDIRLKPEFYKPKMVNAIDTAVLGYRNADEGLAIFKKPRHYPGDAPDLPRGSDAYKDWLENGAGKRMLDEAVAPGSPLRADFDAAVGRGDLVEADWATVQKRYQTRLKEWWEYEDLFKKEFTDNGMPMGFNSRENGVAVEIEPPNFDLPTNRAKFALDGSGRGPDEFLVRIADFPGPNGVLKRVAGDIDIIAILDADGGPVLDNLKRAKIYKFLSETIGIQHPETATWDNYRKALDILKSHVDGTTEPLATFAPKRKPVAAVIDKATLDGTPAGQRPDVKMKGVFRDTGVREVDVDAITAGLPTPDIVRRVGVWSFLAGRVSEAVDTESRSSGFVAAVVSRTVAAARDEPFDPDDPGIVHRLPAKPGGRVCDVTQANIPGTSAGREHWQSRRVQLWRAGSWVDVDLAAVCPTGAMTVMPSSTLGADLARGATSITVVDPVDAFGPGVGARFAPGQTLVIDPGGANEETIALGPTTDTLASPAQRDHERGELVIAVAAQVPPPVTTSTAPPTTAPPAPVTTNPPASPPGSDPPTATTPPGGTAAPTPPTSAPAPAPALPSTGGDSASVLWFAAIALLLGLVLVGVAFRHRRGPVVSD